MRNDVANTAGRRLRELRKGRGWSHEDLAKELYTRGITVSGATLRNYERGDSAIRADLVAACAQLFAVPVETFFPQVTKNVTDAC